LLLVFVAECGSALMRRRNGLRLAALIVFGCAVAACDQRPRPSSEATPASPSASALANASPSAAGAPAASDLTTAGPPPSPGVPWQPHGLRLPTVRCDFDLPAGWTRSGHPMPDHIAELFAPKLTVIVEERVEPGLAEARERVLAYARSGLLRSEGARVSTDASLVGAHAPGHLLSVRFGNADAGRVEAVALLAFPGLPLVDIVARHDEGDARVREAVSAFVRSLRCAR
jgi:hypothetical protein